MSEIITGEEMEKESDNSCKISLILERLGVQVSKPIFDTLSQCGENGPSEVLIKSEERLLYYKNKWISIDENNLMLLASCELSEDDLSRLVKLQKWWIEINDLESLNFLLSDNVTFGAVLDYLYGKWIELPLFEFLKEEWLSDIVRDYLLRMAFEDLEANIKKWVWSIEKLEKEREDNNNEMENVKNDKNVEILQNSFRTDNEVIDGLIKDFKVLKKLLDKLEDINESDN